MCLKKKKNNQQSPSQKTRACFILCKNQDKNPGFFWYKHSVLYLETPWPLVQDHTDFFLCLPTWLCKDEYLIQNKRGVMMKQNLIVKARQLMDQHGLQEWKLKIDNAKKRLGCCWYNRKTISLSKRHIQVSNEELVIDTVLHEIAHALVGRGHGHDSVWQNMCLKIGAKPNACKEVEESFNDDAPYVAKCEPCNKKWFKYRKPPERCSYSCPRCRNKVVFIKT